MKRRARRNYPNHFYEDDYETTDYFCPSCGKQEVWVECGGGDYYVGESYFCLACNATFNLPDGAAPTNDETELGVIRQLRSGEIEDTGVRDARAPAELSSIERFWGKRMLELALLRPSGWLLGGDVHVGGEPKKITFQRHAALEDDED